MTSNIWKYNSYAGPPRELLQGGTRLLWGPGDRLILFSKLRIYCPIKPLVNFHKTHTHTHTLKKKKKQIKRLWLRLLGPSEIHMPLIGSPGPPQRYRLNPSLIGPVHMYIIIPYYSNRVGNNCVILLSFRRCPAITNYSCGILHIALIWRVAARRTIKWLFCEIGAILSGRFCYWLGVWRISISISIKMLRALGNNSCIW
jgi:hypothetical protein